jgi:adenylate cyclase
MTIKRALFWLASSRRLRALMLSVVAIGATGFGIAAYGTRLLRSLELSTVNTRFSIRGNERAPKNIVVVAIDDTSFSAVNKQWPFPRAVEGRVLNRIAAGHPAAVAFDVVFSQPSSLGQNDDLALLNAVNDAGNKTVFSIQETDGKGNFEFMGSGQGAKLLKEVGAYPASTFFPFDPGGVTRRISYSANSLLTFPVVTAQLATHRRVDPKQFHGGSAWIDYVGPTGRFPTVSFGDVYQHKVPASFFKGKIVLVGATAASLQDLHPTSTDAQMPGVEIQANAIDTILRGFPLGSVPGWMNIVLIVLLGVTVPLASLRLGVVASLGLAVALGVVFAIAVQLAFDAGVIFSFVYPLAALILSAVGSLAVRLITEAFERVRTRDLFARFVPENVVDEVLASAGGLRLGGIQREGTVMFTDLRGFTSFAESLKPDQVINVLNHYLSEMSDAILDHGGTLVAYMGDGIMAVFGAPLPQEDHADRALATAREMLDVRLPRFNAWLREEGLSEGGFRMGIGLNSGHVMSGHVGSERRVEYTAVGDTTNTASRIEGLTKGTPYQLFVSGTTKDALIESPGDLVYVGETEIRGRVGHMQLWSLTEAPEPAEVAEAARLQAAAPGV